MRRESVRRKKIQMREKVGKSRNTVFFQWFVAQEGRKVGSLKRRVRSQLVTGAMKNCTPLWREAHFQVKRYKTPQVRTTFGSWDVEKARAVVARSTFPSQNVQNTSASDDFWKLRCRKSARCCGAKHISKWKCTKHTQLSDHFWKLRCRKSARRCGAKCISKSKVLKTGGLGPLLEVEMSKKCTPLWREAHFQVKSVKNWRSRSLLEVAMSKKCTPLWREAHFEVKMYKTLGVRTIFGGSDVPSLRFTTLHYITLHYTTFHYTSLHYTTLHSTTLQVQLQLHNYTPLHSTTLHYTTLHYLPLHSTTQNYTTLHYIALHYIPLHSTTLHYTTLHYTEWHCTTDRQVDR